MFGTLDRIQGKQVLITLDDEIDMYKVQRLSGGKKPTVELDISDGRKITPSQRKKIYALINDLCEYTGTFPNTGKKNSSSWLKRFSKLMNLVCLIARLR